MGRLTWIGMAAFVMLVAAGLAFGLRVAGSSTVLPENVLPLTVHTPHGGFNRLTVSVTVCEPGTQHCATIDDIMVDTGSTGLRLEASAVPGWLTLPAFHDPDGRPLAECLRFVHDDAWGPLVRADVRLGGLTAPDLPLQIIADDGRPQPDGCPVSTVLPTSNGTLGLGPHRLDCQGSCEQSLMWPGVFVEDAGTWVPVRGPVEPASRLPNPLIRLPRHGNGIVFDIPAPPDGGAIAVTGTLTLGVGTAANDQIGDARVLPLDRDGRFTTRYDGTTYPDSFIDSGTETTILPDRHLPLCAGMAWAFCVTPTRRLDAMMVRPDGTAFPMPLKVGDYRVFDDRRFGASDSVVFAAPVGASAVVWGAPLFLGRRVALVLDGQVIPGRADLEGPFYAFP